MAVTRPRTSRPGRQTRKSGSLTRSRDAATRAFYSIAGGSRHVLWTKTLAHGSAPSSETHGVSTRGLQGHQLLIHWSRVRVPARRPSAGGPDAHLDAFLVRRQHGVWGPGVFWGPKGATPVLMNVSHGRNRERERSCQVWDGRNATPWTVHRLSSEQRVGGSDQLPPWGVDFSISTECIGVRPRIMVTFAIRSLTARERPGRSFAVYRTPAAGRRRLAPRDPVRW
jgi:hypothetical protein